MWKRYQALRQRPYSQLADTPRKVPFMQNVDLATLSHRQLLTALLFVLCFWQIGFTPFLVVSLVLVAALVSLMFIDAEHMILPNVITYPLLVFALAVRVLFPIFFSAEYFRDLSQAPASWLNGQPIWIASIAAAATGALLGGGSLWLIGEIWKLARGVDAMGLGDVKMMLGVGTLLGWKLTLLAIFLAAFSGALIGIAVIARQKDKNFQAQIPFGIFLGIGSITALLFGDQMIHWYTNNFIP
jgi:leader peptidase (prepilin peptidase)/N-methyltransferase